ncbi:hypothetical protein [Oceanobacillus luteolus]|uniref:Uncharacterized protein n=1 Tax=Oceanobacillus luteolus TaxID=1274358 RepID=A0ABW4HQZ8_9BACI
MRNIHLDSEDKLIDSITSIYKNLWPCFLGLSVPGLGFFVYFILNWSSQYLEAIPSFIEVLMNLMLIMLLLATLLPLTVATVLFYRLFNLKNNARKNKLAFKKAHIKGFKSGFYKFFAP